ncbi:MAG: hypothetical protein H6712_22605 [Myxococcales bacterium]|nr:hypothetical protein [Myxococcales bacterium]MCB9716666.1 hypothetical protein [Myxococcales bacterium]
MSASSQAPVPDTLDLASLYLGSPAGRAHTVSLKLSEESGGNRKGTLVLDPNICTIDEWGDRQGCTKIALRAIDVVTTRMRTLDPSGHRRVLHEMTSDAFGNEKANLIEYPAAGLWSLVYTVEGEGHWVVPLFDAELVTSDPAGTIIMRYGVPMRDVLERGDLEEMKREIATVRSALAALDAVPGVRTTRALADDHVADVRAALAELEAAVAESES